ncbi:MAG TPA: SBBP repeat-containing protein [Pyrinomonadaceae bacterium]
MKGQRNIFGYLFVGVLTLALLWGAVATPVVGGNVSGARESRTSSPMSLAVMSAPNSPTPNAGQLTHAAASYGKAPLSFETNQGQFDPSVKFLARGPGYQLYLSSTEAVLSLKRDAGGSKNKPTEKDSRSQANARRSSTGDVVRMRLLGARSEPRVSGEDLLPGKVNYLLGNDPRAWRTNITTYGKVKYENVYQGIDLVYYGSQRQLEYDFHVAPGADPGAIRFGFEGVRETKIDAVTGDLIMWLSGGEVIRQHKPVLYQEVGGARRAISGRFALLGHGQVGFEVGTYDKSRALIIDPVLVYATYFGGDGDEATAGIAVDSTGSVYVTGSFVTSPGFPVTPNAFQKTQNSANGNGEVFITKFTPDGAGIVYSTLLGGSSTDTSTGLGLDAAGNAYVVGWTDSADFPVRNAFQSTLRGFPNAFVTKLNASGSDLLYSTFLGGSSNQDFGTDIAVDASGNAYITGDTGSTNFPVTPGAFRTTHVRFEVGPGDRDGFVSKLNTNASGAASLVYSTFCDIHASFSNSMDIDAAGNAYVTGDARVEKLNAAGSALLYSFTIPDSAANIITGLHTTDIAVDATGQAYVTGFTNSPGLMIVNGFQPAFGGGSFDGFLAKLNASGTSLLYSTYLGGANLDDASAVAVDAGGQAYVVGDTASADFPTRDAFQNVKIGGTSIRGTDIFIAKINTNSNGAASLVFSTFYGATNFDEAAAGVAVDSEGNIYATGFPFRVIFDGIIHTGRAMLGEEVSVPGDESEFDPFILKIANTNANNIRFGAERLSASETAGSFEVTVVRDGDMSAAANVDFATLDGRARSRSDYTSAYGTLRFAPGETAKTFRVLITDDSTVEGDETLYVILHENMPGVALAAPSVAELTITDNDTAPQTSNPIDNREFFVRQHYLDFLNREPDTEGFHFWIERILAACDAQPSQPECIEQRINVSGAFFLSIEFLETGYFVYRLHKASFGSLPHFTPFLRDTQETGRDVVVGRTGWEQQLEQNKQRLLADWVERTDFKAKYDALTNEQYVDALNVNTGNSLTTAERNTLVAGLNAATLTRAQVLRTVAENGEFSRKEFSPAFVLMQYFGYLRRDPDSAGYQFWLNKLNQFGGDFRNAEMVKAFITSGEYRSRFGLN